MKGRGEELVAVRLAALAVGSKEELKYKSCSLLAALTFQLV